MELRTHGVRRYPPTSALLASSAGLGWSTISVELRSHGVIEAPAIVPQYVEICLVVAGNKDGLVRRTGAGFCQEAMPKTGAIWLSPAGVGKEIAITAPIPQTMHLYLPTALFDRLKDDFNLPVTPAHSIRHAVGISDDVIDQIGRSILSELSVETAAGRVYVEAASLTLAARLLQKHCDSGACAPIDSSAQGLDQIRLRRVLDYIAANIKADITLADLAAVAGYSSFHFARRFTLAMGISPHRYISRIRLQNAMTELAARKLPLAQIALNAQFSSQASFTRAFHRAIGNLEQASARIFQMWITPGSSGGSPAWGVQPCPVAERSGCFVTIASGMDGDCDALPIRACARVLNAKLRVGESVEYEMREPRLAYLVPSTGTVDVNGVRIHARDGVAIKDVDIVTIIAIEDADVVMVDVL